MKFATGDSWDYSSILTVHKLDGSPAVEGKDYRLYKDGDWDDAETGVILSEGIVLYFVPSIHFEPDEKWMATIRDDRLVSNEPIEVPGSLRYILSRMKNGWQPFEGEKNG